MSAPDIFGPRPSRQMRQPKKDVLREQLALAADEIIRLRSVLLAYGWDEAGSIRSGWIVMRDDQIFDHQSRPLWKRLLPRSWL